jgi:hypothetical protein
MTIRTAALFAACLAALAQAPLAPRAIEIWHGETQRVGHLGDSQDDFNLMGHVAAWKDLDQLYYRINGKAATPLAFRAYRRLVQDGDFNADIPIGALQMGENTITIDARFRDGESLQKQVKLMRETGADQPLPLHVRWSELKHLNDAGQAVDGHWQITPNGLRTRQIGYDRVFLIGSRTWRDYEAQTEVTIHKVMPKTSPISGGNGIGMILRFAGHVAGGPRFFGSGQPKWGYQPFGSIGWIRWDRGEGDKQSFAQFYPGDSDRKEDKQEFPITEGATYSMRFSCQTMPNADNGDGVTRYRYKVWLAGEPEPDMWTWERIQTSRHALRAGGLALLAHHIDATFGDVTIQPVRED